MLFYRDLVLLADPNDCRLFMNSIFVSLHEKHSQLNVAVAFPSWEDAAPNNPHVFENTRHASPGKVMRLFAQDANALEHVIEVLRLEEMVKKHVLFVTPVLPAPASKKFVAYIRDRSMEKATRAGRKTQDTDRRESLSAEAIRGAHTTAYVSTQSLKNEKVFSLFISRMVTDAAVSQDTSWGISSYGLSSKTKPLYLPEF